jgi:hypothetical protein
VERKMTIVVLVVPFANRVQFDAHPLHRVSVFFLQRGASEV